MFGDPCLGPKFGPWPGIEKCTWKLEFLIEKPHFGCKIHVGFLVSENPWVFSHWTSKYYFYSLVHEFQIFHQFFPHKSPLASLSLLKMATLNTGLPSIEPSNSYFFPLLSSPRNHFPKHHLRDRSERRSVLLPLLGLPIWVLLPTDQPRAIQNAMDLGVSTGAAAAACCWEWGVCVCVQKPQINGDISELLGLSVCIQRFGSTWPLAKQEATSSSVPGIFLKRNLTEERGRDGGRHWESHGCDCPMLLASRTTTRWMGGEKWHANKASLDRDSLSLALGAAVIEFSGT